MRSVAFLLMLAFLLETAAIQGEPPARRKRRPSPIDSQIFLGEWWDYYNRAIRRVVQGDLGGAESDLRMALKYRTDDNPRARTYGVRFQEYFPNAELGAILFEQGRFAEAVPVLKVAIVQVDLEQTRFFLHEAQRMTLAATGADRAPPGLVIDSPPGGAVTAAGSVQIRGTATDDLFVDRILINDAPLIIDRGQSRIDFEEEVSLSPGANRISVEIVDLAGRSAVSEILVEADHQGPVLSLERMVLLDGGAKAHLIGSMFDRHQVNRFSINGTQAAAAGASHQTFDLEVPLSTPDGGIRIELEDGFGNRTLAAFDPKVRVGAAPSRPSAIEVAALAVQPSWIQTSTGAGPVIELQGLQHRQRVFQENPVLDLQIRDASRITELRVDGRPLEIPSGSNLTLSCLLGPLSQGVNSFDIVAKDESGEVSQRTLELEYQLPFPLAPEEKLKVVLPDFEVFSESFGENTARQLHLALKEEIVKSGRFEFVETEERVMSEIFRERSIAMSDAHDSRFRPSDRTLLAADLVFDVQTAEGPRSISIHAAAVSVHSGLVEHQIPRTEFKSEESIFDLARILARKLEQAYPQAHGEIFQAASPSFLSTLSKRDGVRGGMQALAFRRGGTAPLPNGRSLASQNIPLGPLVIHRVLEDHSEARKAPNLSVDPQVGDLVVVR